VDLDNTLQSSGASLVTLAGSEAPGEPDELARGTAIGRYLLLGKLGAGGMGVVYVAHDPELDRKVALKLLAPRAGGGSGEAGRARLLREAQALAKLSHPNVVAVHDVGQHEGAVWIAMEFVAGTTLHRWAEARPRRWPEVLRVLTDAARGVTAAHAVGLVHRDLKPLSRFPC
jgi:serine/threonine protein kinase